MLLLYIKLEFISIQLQFVSKNIKNIHYIKRIQITYLLLLYFNITIIINVHKEEKQSFLQTSVTSYHCLISKNVTMNLVDLHKFFFRLKYHLISQLKLATRCIELKKIYKYLVNDIL